MFENTFQSRKVPKAIISYIIFCFVILIGTRSFIQLSVNLCEQRVWAHEKRIRPNSLLYNTYSWAMNDSGTKQTHRGPALRIKTNTRHTSNHYKFMDTVFRSTYYLLKCCYFLYSGCQIPLHSTHSLARTHTQTHEVILFICNALNSCMRYTIADFWHVHACTIQRIHKFKQTNKQIDNFRFKSLVQRKIQKRNTKTWIIGSR